MQNTQLLMGQLSDQGKVLGNLVGSALAMEIAALKSQRTNPLVVICADSQDAIRLEQELRYLSNKEQIVAFRDYETLPFDMLSPHQDIISSRLEFLSTAPNMQDGIVITSIHAVMQRLCPVEYVKENSFILKVGEQKDIDELKNSFVEHGYLQVEQVLSHGEFAVRGSILDVFPMGSDSPLRIDFFDDEVDSIAYFDVQTQRSMDKVNEVKLLPANEFPLDVDSIPLFRSRYRDAFVNVHLADHTIYQSITKGAVPSGIEYYLPLFFPSTSTIFDYLNEQCAFILVGDFDKQLKAFDVTLHQRANLFRGNHDHPSLPVYDVFLKIDEFKRHLKGKEILSLKSAPLSLEESKKKANNNAPCMAVPNISFEQRDPNSTKNLLEFVSDFCLKQGGRILITAQSEGRRQNLRELIPEPMIKALGLVAASSMDDFLASDAKLMMTIAPFDQGVVYKSKYTIENLKSLVIQNEINDFEAKLSELYSAIKTAKRLNESEYTLALAHNKIAEAEQAISEHDGSNESHSATQARAHTLLNPSQIEEEIAELNRHAPNYAVLDQDIRESDLKLLKLESEITPIAILTENELLGYKVRKRKHGKRTQTLDQDTLIKNLAQLREGQVVVHIDHGIGKYRGLKTEVINGIKGEFLTIEYQNGDLLSIPITALNKVARYSGEENPTLSRLGNDAWQRKKNKAAQKVRDVAAELLDIYAQRELRAGFSFKIDKHAYDEFVATFPYEETEDQQKAIDQTLNDMRKSVAMDRLVCGDVGFGKTEVALRAAFVAAMNGKQVAVLSPTTILAEQHFENFKERFAATPITVDMLSRFRSHREQAKTIAAIEAGAVDIVIGTHRLLSSKIKFKDLGLLIIDEEHRFGVRQKEKLKALRSEVDLLTLTATPIPRTLNMAMEGMRELSVIATPPEHRLPVKTFIHEDSDTLCREAIMRELRRGGQVYYLHNDVATMPLKLDHLTKLVPEAKIEVAHGQMEERQLQKVMQDFYHQRFNVLLCSTIIENGLDIPTANTIIIDRSDMLGLAQLHQIRGRVGRSHHQAYAYFFTPPRQVISKDAIRRLEAISNIDELGAGFALASHDLEIRGAGELLGEEQSGQITAVGFSLYMEMLNAAVNALKEGHEPTLSELSLNECDIDMHIASFFPDNYIRDITTRLSMYKRVASCKTPEEFNDLKIELIDRFGNLPKESENLFTISRLKRIASDLGINKIRGDENGALIDFDEHHKVQPEYLISLVQKSKHGEYRIPRDLALRYNLPESEKHSRLKLLEMVLKALYVHSSAVPPKEAQ